MFEKRGISPVIGYVMLVIIALAVGALIFTWMRGFAPAESNTCRDGISLAIVQTECDENWLNLTSKNNGRFNVGGYSIIASVNPDSTIGSVPLAGHWVRSGSHEAFNTSTSALLFVPANGLNLSENRTDVFNLSGIGNLSFIQILPIRQEVIGGKKEVLVCGKAEIRRHEVSCD